MTGFSVKFLLLWLSITCVTQCDGKAFRSREDRTSQADVEASIATALAGNIPKEQLEQIQAVLRPMCATLPTNDAGRFEHKAVRYVLHRFFVQRHGWMIRGLDPGNDTFHTSSEPATFYESGWAATLLQDRLEKRMGNHGLDLHDIASLAAALEDLIHKESDTKLADVYGVLGLSTIGVIDDHDVHLVLETFMMVHLKNITLLNREDANRKLRNVAASYKGWDSTMNWLKGIVARNWSPDSGSASQANFALMARLTEQIGDEFGAFNDRECQDLKRVLTGMEAPSRKIGRVRLADFYNQTSFTHWNFNEKIEYLRTLGALDESNVSQPLLIVPNYVLSRSNCLKANALYTLCCRSECEELMGSVERFIAAPMASPENILRVVTTLSSDTIKAPREVSESLVNRLKEVASVQGGEVFLHSRLFTQWMHHAYPRECPYPHEAGTINPQTADEWAQATGQASHASQEEMTKVVEDSCAMGEHVVFDDLPWSHADEILGAQEARVPRAFLYVPAFMTIGLWGTLGFFFARGKLRPEQKRIFAAVFIVCLMLVCAVVLYLLDRLDGAAFAMEVIVVVVLVVAKRLMSERQGAKGKLEEDCV